MTTTAPPQAPPAIDWDPFYTPTREDILTALQRTRDALVMFGWHQGSSVDAETGKVCLAGALSLGVGQFYLAQNERGTYEFRMLVDKRRPLILIEQAFYGTLFRAAIDIIQKKIIERTRKLFIVTEWNDLIANSSDEVISLLEEIIHEYAAA